MLNTGIIRILGTENLGKIKRIVIFMVFLILLFTCSIASTKIESNASFNECEYFLHQDTIQVNIKGYMTHALKYKDKFYVLFEQRVLQYGGHGKRWLNIFSDGHLERRIDCPKEMETAYLDFYAKNDSLFLKPYMNKQSYYLDLSNYRWIEIDNTDDLIFEDEEFLVYSLDFGEWGGKTWFKEKRTAKEYVLEATTPLVNKIDSTYYLTNSFRVLKIENPRFLNKCSGDITYENIASGGRISSLQLEPTGFEIEYRDTTFDYFDIDDNPRIVSSFVSNKELLHIYSTDTATYIARHQRNSIQPMQKIADNMIFLNQHFSYRCLNLKANNELLKFYTSDEQVFGLLQMVDDEIQIKYFENEAMLEPKSIGAEKADSIITNRLRTILPVFKNLKLSTIDSKEQNWGSFDITPNHSIGVGNSWNPNNYIIDTCRSYLIKEDSTFSNSVLYFGTKENSLIRVVTSKWDCERDRRKPYSEKQIQKMIEKVEFLIDNISRILGTPVEDDKDENLIRRTWVTTEQVKVALRYNRKYNEIKLAIYEK